LTFWEVLTNNAFDRPFNFSDRVNLSIWNSLTGLALWNARLTSRRQFEILISRPFIIWVLSIITCFWS
jgi:hypothetical protein